MDEMEATSDHDVHDVPKEPSSAKPGSHEANDTHFAASFQDDLLHSISLAFEKMRQTHEISCENLWQAQTIAEEKLVRCIKDRFAAGSLAFQITEVADEKHDSCVGNHVTYAAEVEALEHPPARRKSTVHIPDSSHSRILKWETMTNEIIRLHYGSVSVLKNVWREAKLLCLPGGNVKFDPIKNLGERSTCDQNLSWRTVKNCTAAQHRRSDWGGAVSAKANGKRNIWKLFAWSPLHPYSVLRTTWDMASILLCLYELAMVPTLVFDLPKAYSNWKTTYDIISACFWTTDLLVCFRTGYHSPEGVIELSPGLVAFRYLKTWFPVDAAIVCCDWMNILMASSSAEELGKLSGLGRMTRVLRLPKLGLALEVYMSAIQSETILIGLGIVKRVVIISFLSHYIACLWYALTRFFAPAAWSDKFLVDDANNMAFAYTTSLHWALTQFTPASMEVYPTNVYERIFVCIVIILALVTFSSFISSMTQSMQHLTNLHAHQQKQEALMRKFFSEYKIPREVAGRVRHFMRQHKLLAGRRIKEADVTSFKLLPPSMREDLRTEALFPLLGRHPLFLVYFNMSPIAMRKLITSGVVEVSMLPSEELLWGRQEVDKMIFVWSGLLEYHHGVSDFEPIKMYCGEWACEETLWASNPQVTGPFVAGVCGCELLKVNPVEFQSIARMDSANINFIVKYAENFLERFNIASSDESYIELLFNDPDTAMDIICEASTIHPLARATMESNKPRSYLAHSSTVREIAGTLKTRATSVPWPNVSGKHDMSRVSNFDSLRSS